MSSQSSERLVITEYPIVFWLIGGVALLFSLVIIPKKDGLVPGMGALTVALLFLVVFATITTIICDRPSGQISIRSRSLLRKSVKEYLFTDISSIEVESTHTHGHNQSPTYRIAFILITGESVPLHSYYSSGYFAKAKKANRLSEFMGLQGPSLHPENILQTLKQALVHPFQQVQQGETSGVSWAIETSTYGASPITRWVSSGYQSPGQFLLIVQKPEQSRGMPGAGFLSGLSSLLYRQLISMYGFAAEDTPGVESAQVVPLPSPGLGDHFTAYSSFPQAVQQIVTPWVTNLLDEWPRRYPMRLIQRAEPGLPGQLTVLFSPQKLYLVVFGAADEQQTQELIQLGTGLIREAGRIGMQ